MWFFDIGMLRDRIYFTIFLLIGISATVVFYVLHRNGNFIFTTKKPDFTVNTVVGYGLTFSAFLATIVSFIPGIGDTKDKIYLSILFALSLVVSFIYDGLARKYNALLLNLEGETKGLINSYHQLKEYEINESYNRAFADFTRYTNYVCGVQIYNYHLLPKLYGGSVKIEFESGNMQEGVNINAIMQNYYDYESEIIKELKRAIIDIRINNNFDGALNLLKDCSDKIKEKSFKDDALIAIWLVIVEQLIESGRKGKKDVSIDDFIKTFLGESKLHLNKNIGLFKFILYSDILKLKSGELFMYQGDNELKQHRQYLALKAVSDKGIKKIFLVVIDTRDFDGNTIDFLISDIIKKLQAILNSNNLLKLSYTISNGKGEIDEKFSEIAGGY